MSQQFAEDTLMCVGPRLRFHFVKSIAPFGVIEQLANCVVAKKWS